MKLDFDRRDRRWLIGDERGPVIADTTDPILHEGGI